MFDSNNKINNTTSSLGGKEFLSSDINALNKNMMILNKIDNANFTANINENGISRKRNFDPVNRERFERLNGSKEKMFPVGTNINNNTNRRNTLGINHNNSLSNPNSGINANSIGPSNEIIFEDEMVEDKGTGVYSYFNANPLDSLNMRNVNNNNSTLCVNSIITPSNNPNSISSTINSTNKRKNSSNNIGGSNSQEKMLTLNLKINKYINEIKTNKQGNTSTLTGAGVISTKNSNKNFPNLKSILSSISPKNRMPSAKTSSNKNQLRNHNNIQDIESIANTTSNNNKIGLDNLLSDEQRYDNKNNPEVRRLSYGRDDFSDINHLMIEQDNIDLMNMKNNKNVDLNQIQTQFSTSMKITSQNLSDRIFPDIFLGGQQHYINKNTERQESIEKKLLKSNTNIKPNKVVVTSSGPISLIQPLSQSKVNYFYNSPKNKKENVIRPLSNIHKSHNTTNIGSNNVVINSTKYSRLQSALLSSSKSHFEQGILSSNRKVKPVGTISKTLSSYDSTKIASNINKKYAQSNTISSNRLTRTYASNILDDRTNTHSTHSNSNHIRKNNSFINNLSEKNWIDKNNQNNNILQSDSKKIAEVYNFINGNQIDMGIEKINGPNDNENNTIDYGSITQEPNTENMSGIKRSLLERINSSQNKSYKKGMFDSTNSNNKNIHNNSNYSKKSNSKGKQNNSLINLRAKNFLNQETDDVINDSNNIYNINSNKTADYLNLSKENLNLQKKICSKLSNSLVLSSENSQKLTFPKSTLISIRILSCYNMNEKEVGLTEIDFFDKIGQKIEIIDASSPSINNQINSLISNNNSLLNLFNGQCYTINESDMFKTPFLGSFMININIENENIGSISIWNYNGSNTGIGVKEMEIYKKNICIWKGKINRGVYNCKVDYSTKIKISNYNSEDFQSNVNNNNTQNSFQRKTIAIKSLNYNNIYKDALGNPKKGYVNSISSLNSARNQIGSNLNYFTSTIDDGSNIKRNNSINIKKRKERKLNDDGYQNYSYEKNILRTSIGKNSIDVIKEKQYDNYTFDENNENSQMNDLPCNDNKNNEEDIRMNNNEIMNCEPNNNNVNEISNNNNEIDPNSFGNFQEDDGDNSILNLNSIDYSNYTGSVITCTKIKMEFTSNYGHRKFIGLTGIQFIDEQDCLINIEEVASTIGAMPKDIRSYYNKEDDQRIFENTFNNINLTNDDRFMWLTIIKENEPLPYFEITMKEPIKIKKIKMYNYNHPNDLDKCIKTLDLYFDDHLNEPYKKTIILHKGVGESNVDYCQEITFPYEQKEISQEELEPYFQVKNTSMLFYQHYETPYLPFGYVLKFSFISNYGNTEKIGLEKIDLFDQLGRDILNPKYKNQYKIVYNNGSTVFQSGKGKAKYTDTFLMDHLGYGACEDEFEENMSGCNVTSNVYFIFNFPVGISHMKIHNYKEDVTIGVKEIKIFHDGNVIFQGILNQSGPFADPNTKDPKRANITLILFTCDKKITTGIDETLLSKNTNRGHYDEIVKENSKSYTLISNQ